MIRLFTWVGILLFVVATKSFALTFTLLGNSNQIIGEMQLTQIDGRQNISRLARQYDLGELELLAANPILNIKKVPKGEKIIIPTAFILPDTPHDGITINLAELRLYYYPPHQNIVMTYPIGVGRMGWETPLGTTSVMSKEMNPSWYVPSSIHEYMLQTKGINLPEIVPPGPNNPLGDYALHLAIGNYLIHGTSQPSSIGNRSSSGCIRMYPEDIAELFENVSVGTPVYIVHEPYKLAWYNDHLYVEAHIPLPEYQQTSLAEQIHGILQGSHAIIDWKKLYQELQNNFGFPVLIGQKNL